MLDTQTFARKPFYVQAVRVSEQNFDAIAKWVGGEILEAKQGRFVKVDVARFLYERQTQAFVGDWVLNSKTGDQDNFKVYTDAAFRRSFDLVSMEEMVAPLAEKFSKTDAPKPGPRKTAINQPIVCGVCGADSTLLKVEGSLVSCLDGCLHEAQSV